MFKFFLKILNNIETLLCEILLATFVLILFSQIIARQFFQYNIGWSEELSTYMFVWFAYLGAVVAAKMSAHNRVTFHFKFLPSTLSKLMLILSDLLWLLFNVYFVYLSYDFIFNKMNAFWTSQTLGVSMRHIYMILPIAFSLMSIRIIINIYLVHFKGLQLVDPETKEIQKMATSRLNQGD